MEEASGYTKRDNEYLIEAADMLENCEDPGDLTEGLVKFLSEIYERARVGDGAVDVNREDLSMLLIMHKMQLRSKILMWALQTLLEQTDENDFYPAPDLNIDEIKDTGDAPS